MTWDFPEVNPFAEAAGDIGVSISTIATTVATLPAQTPGIVTQMDARAVSTHGDMVLISTDPPYYDNVPYADLSDYFYVWLRRSLAKFYPQLLSTVLVPKAQELVAEPFRHGGKDAARTFFEHGMKSVFEHMRETCASDYPTTIYYAFKQTEDDEDEDDGSDRRVIRTLQLVGKRFFKVFPTQDGRSTALGRCEPSWEIGCGIRAAMRYYPGKEVPHAAAY